MSKVDIKRTLQRSKDVCVQLLYLIPGATLCSKFNYPDAMPMKLPVSQSLSFFFFMKKILKNRKYTVEMRTYSPDLNPPPLHAPVCFRYDSPPSPYLRMCFMDSPQISLSDNIFRRRTKFL